MSKHFGNLWNSSKSKTENLLGDIENDRGSASGGNIRNGKDSTTTCSTFNKVSDESHAPETSVSVPTRCSICGALLGNEDAKDSENSELEDDDFLTVTVTSIPCTTLLSILDVDFKSKDVERATRETFNREMEGLGGFLVPLCKPCYVEVMKYEKLKAELQRIVDQVVATLVENLDEGIHTDIEGSPCNNIKAGPDIVSKNLESNPIAFLKHAIFKRWKPNYIGSSGDPETFYEDLAEILESNEGDARDVPNACEVINKPGESHMLDNQDGSESLEHKGFFCDSCKKEFRQQRDLDVHIRRSHTGERPFICEICEKSYPAQSTLYQHKKVHLTRFVCDICGVAVVTENGLRKHMMIHEGRKNFQCEICAKDFLWKQSLLKHKALHSVVKPFTCNFCSKEFHLKDYLDKHMGRRHPELRLSPSDVPTPLLSCPYCNTHTTYRTSGNLSSHILKKHSSASASFL